MRRKVQIDHTYQVEIMTKSRNYDSQLWEVKIMRKSLNYDTVIYEMKSQKFWNSHKDHSHNY